MSLEPGGYADRLGGRYQDRWAVYQLLHVLAEEVRSVIIEPAGPDEQGVDLWIVLPDGVREAHQCKAENRGSPQWTVAALAQRGILRNLRFQLERSPQHRFRFVSAVPAVEFKELVRSAEHSSDPESFYRHQIQAGPNRKRKAFERFCREVNMDPARAEDRYRAHDLLLRSGVHLFAADDPDTRRDMRGQARFLIEGDPATALSVLEDLVRDQLRRPIHADDIARHLRAHGLQLRNLSRDERLRPLVESLRRQFVESLRPQLAGGRLIERPETQIVLETLRDDKAPRLIVIHGSAGVGKSGVLYELTTQLDESEFPYLPLRLDRQRPSGSLQSYSDELRLLASPAAHLRALACDRQGVLILDQLDALRWTSAHASNAWAVGQEIIREALQSNLQVVVCCRTFDLEKDPQIRDWKKSHQRLREIPIGDLDDGSVRRAIEDAGGAYDLLTQRQRSLLRNALHLKIWLDIFESGDVTPQFESQRELMRAFWESRLQQLHREGVSESEAHALLDHLVEWMDEKALLIAPERLLRRHTVAAKALQSLGVLQVSDETVTFAHQSYVDSLLADRLMEKIDIGESTLLDWLGERSRQSLFRREQLRLVLGTLRDETSTHFLTAVSQLLASKSVRFHLKQLVLQFLGQLEIPLPQEIEIVSDLLEEDAWRDQVVGETIYNRCWFEALDDRGVWARWLADENAALRDDALRILRGVAETCGDRIARLLAPYEKRDEYWSRRCVNVLSFNPAKDSDELFAMRLRLIEAGFPSDVVKWRELSATSFTRLRELLFAMLLHWAFLLGSRVGSEARHWQPRMSWLELEDVDPESADAQELILAWHCLIPAAALVLKASQPCDGDTTTTLESCSLDLKELEPIFVLLRKIGSWLAQWNWHVFPWLSEKDRLDSTLARLLMMEILITVPQVDEELADWALRWLIEEPERLRLRYGHRDSPWAISGALVERFTLCCSEGALHRFEDFLMNFREADLIEDYRRRDEFIRRNGIRKAEFKYYPSCFGRTQHQLLARLPRLSPQAEALLRVLKGKFGGPAGTLANKPVTGYVSSPLTPEVLERLNDKTWLGIITNEELGRPRRLFRQGAPGRLLESSPRTFSVDLQTVTERQPERFARLALRFPASVNPAFLEALLRGVQKTSPPKHLPADRHDSWSPASGEALEKVLKLPQVREKSQLAIEVARILRSHAQHDWPLDILDDLLNHAMHHDDPRRNELNVRSSKADDWDTQSLDDNVWNSTRSVAAHALSRILFAHQESSMLERLRPGIESLVADPHPVVRTASTAVCLAALDLDSEQALTWFFQACDSSHDAVLACHDVRWFLDQARWDHYDRLQPFLVRMIESEVEQVAEAGAEIVTGCFLTQGLAEDLLKRCLERAPAQKRGVARLSASWLSKPRFHVACKNLLKQLAEDGDEEVLRAVGGCFYSKDCDLSLFEPRDEFLIAFARSKAFQADPSTFLHTLEAYEGPLVIFADCVLQASQTIAQHLAEASHDMQTSIAGDIFYLSPLMLRLYDQSSEDPEYKAIHQQCLDVWDLLIEKRVGIARELTDALDKV